MPLGAGPSSLMLPVTDPTADNAPGVYTPLPKSTEPVAESSILIAAPFVDGARLGRAGSFEQASTNVAANRAVMRRLGRSRNTILATVRIQAVSGIGEGKRRAMRRRPSRPGPRG